MNINSVPLGAETAQAIVFGNNEEPLPTRKDII